MLQLASLYFFWMHAVEDYMKWRMHINIWLVSSFLASSSIHDLKKNLFRILGRNWRTFRYLLMQDTDNQVGMKEKIWNKRWNGTFFLVFTIKNPQLLCLILCNMIKSVIILNDEQFGILKKPSSQVYGKTSPNTHRKKFFVA